jgi:hypothetical protein
LRNRALQKAALERHFKKTLSQVTPSPEVWGAVREAILAYWQSTERLSAARNKAVEEELATLEHRKQAMIQLRVDNELTPEEYAQQRRDLDLKRTELKIALQDTNAADMSLEPHLRRLDNFITRLPHFWDQFSNITHRQAIQRAVYPLGLMYDRNADAFGTANLSVIFELSRKFRDDKSYLVAGVGRCWNQLLQAISDLARMIEEFESGGGGAATNVVGVAAPGLSMLARQYRGRGDGYKAA